MIVIASASSIQDYVCAAFRTIRNVEAIPRVVFTVTVSFSTWGDGQVACESSKSLNCGWSNNRCAVVAGGRVALGAGAEALLSRRHFVWACVGARRVPAALAPFKVLLRL